MGRKVSVFVLGSMLAAGAVAGCNDKPKVDPSNAPPPPPSASAKAGACEAPGVVNDKVSASYFSKKISNWCIDPTGEVRTYGENAKLTMDEVCTTAFDGECEVYKRFGLKRVVSMRYADGNGKGGTVEVYLSQFADDGGAYGMFTLRVVAGDPAEPSTPKVLEAGSAGAIGTGRAYVWRGAYLVELQYVNENESPKELTASSDAALRAVGKDIGEHLPGAAMLPPSAVALPTASRIANGIVYQPKDVMGFTGVGPAALGFYKEGDRRWRVLSMVKGDAEQAKDAFKTMKSKPGSLPISNIGDEAAHVVVPTEGGGPKIEMLLARRGASIYGIADEEYALRAAGGGDAEAKARLTKDEATAKIKPLLAAIAGPASPPTPTSSSGKLQPAPNR